MPPEQGQAWGSSNWQATNVSDVQRCPLPELCFSLGSLHGWFQKHCGMVYLFYYLNSRSTDISSRWAAMVEMRDWRYVSPEASHVLLFSNVAFSAFDRERCYDIETATTKLTGNILVKPLRGSPLSEASRMVLNLVVILLPFVSLTFNFGSSGGRLTTSILVTSNVSVPGL